MYARIIKKNSSVFPERENLVPVSFGLTISVRTQSNSFYGGVRAEKTAKIASIRRIHRRAHGGGERADRKFRKIDDRRVRNIHTLWTSTRCVILQPRLRQGIRIRNNATARNFRRDPDRGYTRVHGTHRRRRLWVNNIIRGRRRPDLRRGCRPLSFQPPPLR